jgi:CHAT domain-containing protein/tetratricopeptide (TPR) repeat protein
MPINYLRLLFVSLVTALFIAAALAQENPGTRQAVDQYLVILKLAGNKDYEGAIVSSKQLIAQAPNFILVYGKLFEVSLAAGQLDQTKAYFEELASRAVPNPGAHYGLGLIHFEQGSYPLAVSSYRQSLEIEPESAPVYRALVLAYREMKKLDMAEEYFKSVVAAHPNSPTALYGLGVAYAQQRAYPKALEALEQSIAINQQFGAAHNLKGIIYSNTEQHRDALASYHTAYEIAETSGDAELKCQTSMNKGDAHFALDNYSEALNDLTNALRMAEEIGDQRREEMCLGKIGDIEWRGGDWSSALDLWRRGLKVTQEILRVKRDPRAKQDMGRHLGNIGVIYNHLGQYDEAVAYYQRAIKVAVEEGDLGSQINFQNNLGAIYTEQNNYVQAQLLFGEAMQAALKFGSDPLKSRVLSGLAKLYRQSGDTKAALDHFQQAMRLAQKNGDLVMEGALHNSLGGLYLSLRDLPSAVASYQRGLEIGESIHVPLIVWQAHAGLAATAARQNRLDEALRHYRQAIEAMEEVRGRLHIEEEKASFLQDKVEVHKALIALLLNPPQKDLAEKYKAEAFHYVERARARAFLDLLAEDKVHVKQDIAPSLLKRRIEIENRIERTQSQLIEEMTQKTPDREKIQALDASLTQADRDHQDWRRDVYRQHPRYSGLHYPEPISLEKAQKTLGEKSLLLEFSLGEPASYLFAISKSDCQVVTLPGASKIRQRVERLRTLLTPKQTSLGPYRLQASSLYDVLIKPVSGLLAGKQELIIVADGALNYVPFEALLSGRGASADPRRLPYLVRDYAISYAPSASVLSYLAVRRAETGLPPKRLLAYGDPSYGNQTLKSNSALARLSALRGGGRWKFPRLPQSCREVKAIARLYPSDEATWFCGDDASEESVKAPGRLGQYRMIHFAVHGLLNETKPQLSGLALRFPRAAASGSGALASEDGLLQAYEIYNLKLNAELVTLSACEGGLGKEVAGEGLINLSRGFIYAGALSVVAGLWQVSDDSTAQLMIRFYKHLQEAKLGRAEALRRAQLEMIRDGKRPFHWAAFILVGKS